jgi:hypothetical protein
MTTREYYLNEYGLDINLLPEDVGNAIASNFIENLIEPENELLMQFKKYGVLQPEFTVKKNTILHIKRHQKVYAESY